MKLVPAYPVRLVCQVLGLPRSSYYYHPRARDEGKVKSAIRAVAGTWPTYGYRRITAQLRRDKEWIINSKRVRRLMAEMGIQGTIKRRKRRTTHSDHAFPRYPNLVQGLKVVRPDQVWVSDITYIHLRREFVYLAVIMDVFTRSIRGWHLARVCVLSSGVKSQELSRKVRLIRFNLLGCSRRSGRWSLDRCVAPRRRRAVAG